MKLQISFGFCAMVCFLLWLEPGFCGWLLLAACCHELGHVLLLRLFRIPIMRLSLTYSGAKIDTGAMSSAVEAGCALAGPMTNVILGLAFLRLLPEFAVINFGLAAVNLLPLYPLDGGRILLCIMEQNCTPECTEKILSAVHFGVCAVLMIAACWLSISLQAGLWPIFAALLLLWRAGNQEKLLQFLRREDKMKKPE